jgi:hypothetical protein
MDTVTFFFRWSISMPFKALADSKSLGVVPSLSTPSAQKPGRRKVSHWIRFQLWFNTYRYVATKQAKIIFLSIVSSKFFVLVLSINLTGLVLAASGKWPYARHYSGACVLGNLLVAILMRNEVFGRLLYLMVNTLFAKVLLFSEGVLFSR